MDTLNAVAALFASAALQDYLGERVTLAQHMLQAAALAEAEGASDGLVAAALVHDIGHVLSRDRRPHELAAAQWLSGRLPEQTCAAVRLHVDAKRYLCAVDPAYFELLSEASRQSLRVQGGPMRLDEAHAFVRRRYAQAAIALRRWDEAAKDPAAATPDFAHFRPLLERVLLTSVP